MAVEKSRRWEQVLVLTTRKGFWASERRALFPNVIYSPQRFGHSNSWANSLLLFVQALWCIVSHKPRLLLFGSAHRVAKWFLWLRHRGLFRKVKLVCHNMVFFWTGLAVYADRIIVFSSVEAEYFQKQVAKQGLYQFIPLPADGEFTIEQHRTEPPYIFSGGGARRDFATAIEAVRGLPVHLKIRCHSPEKLNYSGDLPENVMVGYKVPLQDFLQEMNDALFVVVPLEKTELPHGHTTVAQAMRLGKNVVDGAHGAGFGICPVDGQLSSVPACDCGRDTRYPRVVGSPFVAPCRDRRHVGAHHRAGVGPQGAPEVGFEDVC